MSEANRVFSRMTSQGSLPSPEDKQFLHITSRRRGATANQSRVVEVVHRRSGRTASTAEPAQAAPWQESLQGYSAPALPPAEKPAVTPVPVPQIGHLMPGWTPLLPPLEPAKEAAKIQPRVRAQQRAAKPVQSKGQPVSTKRAFADPFAADDVGTNCIRCGYLVSPSREKRGLMTCMRCR